MSPEPARPYGCVDAKGRFAIKPRFTDAQPFDGGLALVGLGAGVWGYIDREGKLVWDSTRATVPA